MELEAGRPKSLCAPLSFNGGKVKLVCARILFL